MTVVEVLVASSLSAVLATGAAGLMATGGRVADQALHHVGEATALAQVLEWLPSQMAGHTSGPPTAPAPGWQLTHHATTQHANGSHHHLEWLRPDGTTLVVTTWRHGS